MALVAATLQNQKTGETLNDQNWFRLRSSWEKMARIINGALTFGSPANPTTNQPAITGNIGGTWVTVTTPAPGTDFTVTTNLNRAAAGYLVMSQSAAGNVTTSPTTNTAPTTSLILRSTAPAGTTITLFVV